MAEILAVGDVEGIGESGNDLRQAEIAGSAGHDSVIGTKMTGPESGNDTLRASALEPGFIK